MYAALHISLASIQLSYHSRFIVHSRVATLHTLDNFTITCYKWPLACAMNGTFSNYRSFYIFLTTVILLETVFCFFLDSSGSHNHLTAGSRKYRRTVGYQAPLPSSHNIIHVPCSKTLLKYSLQQLHNNNI